MQLGYAETDVRNLIEYGIPEDKVELLVDIIQAPYVNPLLYQNRVLTFAEHSGLQRGATMQS